MEFKKTVQSIHQIELTNHCNLKCIYCIQPLQDRERGFMSEETFHKSIAAVKHCVEYGSQKEVWLHGLGESLLHPHFLEFCEYARDELTSLIIRVSSNGILMTEEICKKLRELEIRVHISLHKPDNANDWAGQLEWWHLKANHFCSWIRERWAYVLFDGNISHCCLDTKNPEIIGNIDHWQDIEIKPFSLCEPCNLTP